MDLSRRLDPACARMVYVFPDGANPANSTTPDDYDGLGVEPLVMVKADEVTGAYRATFLPSGNYTVAYTCAVDEPGVDDSLDVPAFSFQGHPEASPGPHDVSYLFDRFIQLMADHAKAP